ncbi:ABC transporter permease [Kibdelosporangium philippinense]|uniref:ABC transporter permease n=1 Tax=Kibdelosporangium philippinense TaxID=211113 RepID=A0ABS8ZAJ7_9PSEU|nr:ABC transporter permease [Kibdelosporangium philippinense]MCE7004179.1 ABC transporter permease [Kibdelosporangium philippinense]
MIWVTWRQQRLQIFAVFGIVTLISAVLVYVRADAVSLLPDKELVMNEYNLPLQYFSLLMLALPVLLGMFFGAPLFAREIESGTHVFGLTQSVSRTRWIVTKLAIAGGSLALAMLILGMVSVWALEPVSFVLRGRIGTGVFEAQGVVVGGYAILAFAIGATAGLVLRNTLAAMVVTLALYTVVLMAVANEVREHYAAPTVYETRVDGMSGRIEPPEAWLLERGFMEADGSRISVLECTRSGQMVACMNDSRFVGEYLRVHLPDRFWRFQFTELGLVLLLSAGVFGALAIAGKRRLT